MSYSLAPAPRVDAPVPPHIPRRMNGCWRENALLGQRVTLADVTPRLLSYWRTTLGLNRRNVPLNRPIVLAGGIGEYDAAARSIVCSDFPFAGADPGTDNPVAIRHAGHSVCQAGAREAKFGSVRARLFYVAATALLVCPASALSQTAQPPAVDGAIEALLPGQFLWAPQLAPAGPVTVIVSLTAQRAYTYRNGVPIGVSTVSSGKKGHATPTGIFTVLQKHIDHKSNLYDDAPMPFMQRLTWDGIALHAGNLPGYPASHGCIRLPIAFAKLLYRISALGMTVVVTDEAEVPVVVAKPGILVTAQGDGAPVADYTWHPEQSPTGPLSIVVSGQDNRVVVLRNGVEIGSGDMRTDMPIEHTVAFSYLGTDAAGEHWVRLPLPGNADTVGTELTEAERSRGKLPEGLRLAIASVLTPGTTLLITRASLRSSGVGRKLTVVTAREH